MPAALRFSPPPSMLTITLKKRTASPVFPPMKLFFFYFTADPGALQIPPQESVSNNSSPGRNHSRSFSEAPPLPSSPRLPQQPFFSSSFILHPGTVPERNSPTPIADIQSCFPSIPEYPLPRTRSSGSAPR